MIEQDPEYTREDLQKLGAKWMERIGAAKTREEDWIKDAEKAETAYLCGAGQKNVRLSDVPDFNILHSNVETIVPAIYNSTAIPEIRPRFDQGDGVAKNVAELLERAIMIQADDNRLDREIEAGAQDAFVAGRDIVTVVFDADVTDGIVSGERVIFENVSWKDYREGPATRWADVPWVAYRRHITIDDMEKLQDPALANLQATADGEVEGAVDAAVWQIWCKETRKVYIVADGSNKVLKIADDPLGLKGFFPQPEPVQPVTGTGSRLPVCPYTVYKSLADELDEITRRIAAIVAGLKVKGLFSGDASVMEELAQADDNTLVPVQNLENLAATGGLEKAVMWWPIQQAIAVLKELFVQREQTKAAIYEVTGISDIIRGQSNAAETATAQNIKTQWGSIRIKKMQRLIERQVRDLYVITAEIIGRHFTAQTLTRMTGIQVGEEEAALLSDPTAHYRINIESDSTIRADASRNRREMTEFLSGSAQYFSTMAPIVQAAPMAAGELIEIYGAFARQFNLGKSAEDALDRLVKVAKQAAENPPPNPEAEAQKAEAEAKAKETAIKAQSEADKNDLERQKLQLDIQIKAAELKLKQQELQLKEGVETVKAAGALASFEQQESYNANGD